MPTDTGGRYLYLRDDRSGTFWSPTWQPTRHSLEHFTCRHGLGYTIIASRYEGIDAEIRYFVPPNETLEVWQVSITNRREVPASLSLFSLVEFALWDAWDDSTNFQRNLSIGEVEASDGVIYHKTEYRERRDHFAYFACSAPLAGYDTDRDTFLGPYRGWDNPQVVAQGVSGHSVAQGWAPIGSHHVRLSLAAGEQADVSFALGYAENPAEHKFDPPGSQSIDKTRVKPVIAHYLNRKAADEAFAGLETLWDGLLGVMQIETPDVHTNRMVNIWNAYQSMATFNLSRSASLFESGIGRGMGFRDSNQDLLGFVHMVPERARERIVDIAVTQLENSGAFHQYQPLTKRGNDAIGSGFNDDPLWLVLAVAAYLKETGDLAILGEPIPYENMPKMLPCLCSIGGLIVSMVPPLAAILKGYITSKKV